MLPYPNIDPVIFHLGPFQVRWYGLMYVLGFFATFLLVSHQIRVKQLKELGRQFENLNVVLILSMVVGGRLGYVLFYNLPYYLQHPFEIAATWQGGMSFHGGLLGLILGGYIFCRRHSLDFWQVADVYVVTIPIGLGLGRIGNFINGELFGRVAAVPWAMIFPGGGPLPRHPSQLYECLLEGLLLFVILWNLKDRRFVRQWPTGSMLAAFLFLYGIFRLVVEVFREPDPQLGFLFGIITMGQLLSFLMIGGGVLLVFLRRKKQKTMQNEHKYH
jgi:phosphatidylglycerol:prolipoprotein diacylglycerol transferase